MLNYQRVINENKGIDQWRGYGDTVDVAGLLPATAANISLLNFKTSEIGTKAYKSAAFNITKSSFSSDII